MKKIVKWSLIGASTVCIAIQFYRPQKTNPPIDPAKTIQSNLNVPPDISSLLNRACADCHSNSTVWPWYSEIAPVSWFVIDDVDEGRKHLNFSEWGKYMLSTVARNLSDIHQELKDGTMPLPKYILMHPEAKLTDQERKQLMDWVEQEYTRVVGGDE